MGSVVDYHALLKLPPDVPLPPVPFAMETLTAYRADRPFDVGFLCRLPEYTPASSDALMIADYFLF